MTERLVLSHSQIAMFSSCSHAWKLKYVENFQQNVKPYKLLLGSIVGESVARDVQNRRHDEGTPWSYDTFNDVFITKHLDEGYPADIVGSLAQIADPSVTEYLNPQTGEVMCEKSFFTMVDVLMLELANQLPYAYKPLSARNKKDRTLVQIQNMHVMAYNGYRNLVEAGLLKHLMKVELEVEASYSLAHYDLTGVFDIVLHYSNGKKVIVELKTPSTPEANLPMADACPIQKLDVQRSMQIRMYHLLGKMTYGDAYAGIYYSNTGYKGHCVKAEDMHSHVMAFLERANTIATMMTNNLTLPVCGVSTHNAQQVFCFMSGACSHVA